MDIRGWQAQLRKGAAELAVLAVLEREESYGLQILDTIDRAGGLDVAEGSIYPLLNRLQKAGKLRSRWVEDPGATHPRKYYSLTAEGRRTLQEMRTAWLRFRHGLDALLQEDSP